ncbi:hypothetical protein ACFRFH_14955 [Leifsonia sp. NPDC056824]|uniref:hypothetical protein n=1 Tax=Leifsonia sp. NPDC056824 TaxID=3345953 RepID=UPI0036BD7784
MPEDWEVGTEVVVKIIEGNASALSAGNEVLLVPEDGAFRVGQRDEYAIVTIELSDAAHVDDFSGEDVWHGTIKDSTGDSLAITLLSDGEATATDGAL